MNILSKRRKEKSKRQRIRHQWAQLRSKVRKWMELTSSSGQPSLVCLYMHGNKLVWEGADHMKAFVEDEMVLTKFHDVALARPVIPMDTSNRNNEAQSVPQLISPHKASTSQLRNLIPKWVNASGRRSFWNNIACKPTWWPQDISFQSPNHSRPGQRKLTRAELIKVVEAFMEVGEDTGDSSPALENQENAAQASSH